MTQTLEEKTEMLDVVDERDQVIGQASRERVNAEKLPHRIVHILVHNSQGKLAMQLRSAKKSYLPGHWCTSAGGYVRAGESYEQAATREILEELGRVPRFTPFLEDSYVTENGTRKFLRVFEASDNGPFKANPDEVERVEFFTMDEMDQMLKSGAKIHPEMRFLLNKYIL